MGSRNFTILAVLIATLYWLADSFIHFLGYGELQFELTPSDFNELWMRILIVLLIIGAGIYVDHATKKRVEAVEKSKQKYITNLKEINKNFTALLDKALKFDVEVRKSGAMDNTILTRFTDSINEARVQLKDVADMTGEIKKVPGDIKS